MHKNLKYWVYTVILLCVSLLMGNSKAIVAMVFLLGISDNTTDYLLLRILIMFKLYDFQFIATYHISNSLFKKLHLCQGTYICMWLLMMLIGVASIQ